MEGARIYALPWGVPFIGLVLTIAMMPLLSPAAWERHYGKAALLWALAFIVPDAIRDGIGASIIPLADMALHQYVPFVLLLGTLYIIAGGLRITGAPHGTPGVNTIMLALGTLIASIIGTPGASLIMLRPLIRANRYRRQTAHIFVFFIFLVANVGGALTPLGNPPLFLGFLKGVPFFWPGDHLALPTMTLALGLLATFYALDRYLRRRGEAEPEVLPEIEKLRIEGRINLVLLMAALATIMLRVVWPVSPDIVVFGVPWQAVDMGSDALLLAIAAASMLLTRPATRRANDFEWPPLVEVIVLFGAIFVTLIPVTAMVAAGANGPVAGIFARMVVNGVPQNALFYRAAGLLSAFLDNAPTYLVFFGLAGGDASRLAGPLAPTLAAISAGACYFGGLTYLGNAPNLMVRTIVTSHGLRMPSFFGYMAWAAICLLPWLLVVEAIFFH